MKVDLVQRSEEWTRWRSGKIGASSVASIMGTNPWETAKQLWCRMKGIAPAKETTTAMQEGIDQEQHALFWCELETGYSFSPECFEHDVYPFIIASLDGHTNFMGQNLILEIKTSQKRLDEAKRGIIPDMYIDQINAQMMVCGAKKAFYCAWWKGEGHIVELDANPARQDQIIQACIEFYESLQGDTPPLDERDFVDVEVDSYQQKVIDGWIEAKFELSVATEKERLLRERIADYTDDGDTRFLVQGKPILTCKRMNRGGHVDYAKLCKDLDITEAVIERYRKKSVGYWKLQKIN